MRLFLFIIIIFMGQGWVIDKVEVTTMQLLLSNIFNLAINGTLVFNSCHKFKSDFFKTGFQFSFLISGDN